MKNKVCYRQWNPFRNADGIRNEDIYSYIYLFLKFIGVNA